MIRVDETDPVGEVEPSFPYRDVTVRRGVDFKDNYDIQSEIGRGKFGTVYHCKEKTSGLMLAAKVVTTTRKEDRRSVEREVEIMRRLQHPRLIQLYDAIDTGKQIYVILELIQGGELFERVIDDDFVLTERSCAVFMRQICEGIEFVHAQQILHLDMKPENILCLTKEGNRIKIIDFGLARHYDPRKKMQVLFGTPEFVAPEVVNFDQIGFGTDMWSIGVICYVLLSGLSPFMGDTDVETMANVTIAKYDFDHDAFADISEEAKDFIRCLLVKDKEKRATATMCRSHQWLSPTKHHQIPRNSIVSVEKIVTKNDQTKVDETATTTTRTKKKKKKKNQQQQPDVIKSSPKIAIISSQELDVTKDNLRLFVERWREHPDSPYLLDSELGTSSFDQSSSSTCKWEERQLSMFTRKDNNNLELVSLRGQSPSPCGSVCTSTASETSELDEIEKVNYNLAVPNPNGSLVLGLERRASEGNYPNTGHRRDQAAQIVLAEEIIKLSEHLRNLASSQPMTLENSSDPKNVIKTNGTSSKVTNNERPNDKMNERSEKMRINGIDNESNEITEKLSSITRHRIINGTTFNGNRNIYEKPEITIGNFSLKKTRNQNEKSEDIGNNGIENNEVENNAGSMENRKNGTTCKNEQETNENMADRLNRERANFKGLRNNDDMDLTPPWRRGRTKHRFGEKCRDVPRISNLRDIHKSLNLDEPKSTKDLLVHLLGEWENDTTRTSGDLGRKSISLDWCGEESIARRSMNSLAEYFQSEQQKTITDTSLNKNSTIGTISTTTINR